MSKIETFMAIKHRGCDQILADAENLISAKDWPNGRKAFLSFSQELNAHLAMEEEVLFPALDEKMGGTLEGGRRGEGGNGGELEFSPRGPFRVAATPAEAAA